MSSGYKPPRPFRGFKPLKPLDRLQNLTGLPRLGQTTQVSAHWRYNYQTRRWEWVKAHWRS